MEIKGSITVNINTNETACRLRECICSVASKDNNPLTETNFNALLDKLANEAFTAGREYERKR